MWCCRRARQKVDTVETSTSGVQKEGGGEIDTAKAPDGIDDHNHKDNSDSDSDAEESRRKSSRTPPSVQNESYVTSH